MRIGQFGPDRIVQSSFFRTALPVLCVVSIVVANILIFFVAPDERVMGAIQRVFYYHVGFAVGAYFMVGVLLISSVLFLFSRRSAWDNVARSSARVGLLFCTIVLASGMIWGRAAWNVWWRWEPRLVSFLCLWLILFSYEALRLFGYNHSRIRNFSAVLGIVAAINVPFVVFSVRLSHQALQLHPEVLREGGLGSPAFSCALIAGIAAVFLLGVWLLLVETVGLFLEEKAKLLL